MVFSKQLLTPICKTEKLNTMKKPITSFAYLILLSLIAQPLYPQEWQQAKRYSAEVGLPDVDNSGIAIAPDSSLYLVGTIRGTVQFDEVTATGDPPNDHSYVLKLNAALHAHWVVTYEDDTYLADVATDPAGNFVVVGSVQESNLTYIAKYNKEGNLLHELVSTGGNSYAKVVKVDEEGNYYVGGWMNQPTAFNGTIPAVNTQGRESYLLKLDADLNVVWATLTGASSQLDEIHSIAFDNDGFIYTSGNYSQSYSLGCFCWNGDFFVEKRNAENGNLVWTKILTGGSGTTTEMYLLANGDTDVVSVAAAFKNTTNFGNGISLSTNSGNDDYHLFTARLNSADGNVEAAAKLTTTGDAYIKGMVHYENALHLYGYFVGILTVDESAYIPMGRDAFHLVIDPADHEPEFAEIFTGPGLDHGSDIDAGPGLVTSGRSTSNTMYIDTFALPGTIRSIYLATTLPEPSPCVPGFLQASANTPLCQGSDLELSAAGASSYFWSGPDGFISDQADPVISEMNSTNAGIYQLIAINQLGCTDTIEIEVVVNAGPQVQIESNSPLCADESLMLQASVGMTYHWEGPQGFESSLANPSLSEDQVIPGIYSLTITDANNCSASAEVNVEVNPPIFVTMEGEQPTCSGSANGQVMAFVTGGTGPFSYHWSNGQTTQIADDLNPGVHTVTVTDNLECSVEASIILDAAEVFGIMINLWEVVSCYGNEDGQIQAIPVGGTGPYSYLWETGDTTASIDDLAPGTYFVTITDMNGCTTTGGAILDEPQPLEVDLHTIDNACNQTMHGVAIANVTGGTAPFIIHWSTGATGDTISALPAGNYEVTITDDRGCETISTLSIGTESYAPDLEIVQQDNGLSVAEENAFYQWLDCSDGNSIEGATEQLFLPNATGEYAVIVSNGICADTSDCFFLTLVATDEINGAAEPAQIFPNPNTGIFTLYLPEAGEVEILNGSGQRISRTSYPNGNHQLMQQELPTGSYLIRIQSRTNVQTLRWIKQ